MATVAVIGEDALVRGFALAGALVLRAETPAEAAAAWRSMPPEVEVAVLTSRAAGWLREAAGGEGPGGEGPGGEGPGGEGPGGGGRPAVLPVVMPP